MVERISNAQKCFRDVLASSRKGQGHRGVPEKTFGDLDWDIFAQKVQQQTSGEDAWELAEGLGILPVETVERRRQEVFELQKLHEIGSRPPMGQPPTLGTPLLRARKVEALSGDDLRTIATSIEQADRLARFFRHHGEETPRLEEHGSRIRSVGDVAMEIRKTFDAGGTIRNDASPKLGKLRTQARSLRDSIQGRLDGYLQDPRFEGILQDDFVTLRDERFVLPIKAGERGDMPGIVHGHSSSGATLYVEPEDLIAKNNELQVARNDVRREEHRILAALTSRVKKNADAIEVNADIISYIDLTNACALVSMTYRGQLPRLSGDDNGEVLLRDARHPLLALREEHGELNVVPNDIRFGEDSRALIVSGPNTGGKTIALKTIGMFAMMTRAGLPVPCHPDSTMPLFDRVFTDIGDEQTVQGDLSTFSAHVSNIASFVDRVVPGTLVLLDELFAGTDPSQATTLGRALLLEIDRLGGWSVVTTHLEGLKSLAFEDDTFACASMGFDIEAFAPTYRLRAGLPGSSYAHRIASRLGLPARIVDQAVELADSDRELETEALLRKLEDAHETIFDEKQRLETIRRDLESDRTTLQEEIEKARAKEDSILSESTQELRQKLRELKDELSEQETRLSRLRSKSDDEVSDEDMQRLQEARRIAEKVQRRTAREVQQKRAAQITSNKVSEGASLKKGDHVYVSTYKQPGVIVEEPEEDDKIVVQMGPVRVHVERQALRVSNDDNSAAEQTSTRVRVKRSRAAAGPSERIDLRGMRVDEAIEQVDAHLEEAVLTERNSITLIHGHGTGALKQAIRAHLPKVSYQLQFRPGARTEGGDGVTVISME